MLVGLLTSFYDSSSFNTQIQFIANMSSVLCDPSNAGGSKGLVCGIACSGSPVRHAPSDRTSNGLQCPGNGGTSEIVDLPDAFRGGGEFRSWGDFIKTRLRQESQDVPWNRCGGWVEGRGFRRSGGVRSQEVE